MKINNRLFCYPVLAGGMQDYKESTFMVDASYTLTGLEWLELQFDMQLKCPDIEALIQEGRAAYAVHIECSETSYRLLRISRDAHFDERISRQQIRGAVERMGLVVLLEDLRDYHSSDFDTDYQDISFDLGRGTILAYSALQILDVEPLFDEQAQGHAVFTVFKRNGKGVQPMTVGLDEQHIMIGLGSDEFDTYARYAQQPQLQPLLNSAIVFPALVYALEQLKYEDGLLDYADLAWFRTLSHAYAQQGSSLEERLASSETPSIELAQELMELPVTQALTHITFAEEDEEDA